MGVPPVNPVKMEAPKYFCPDVVSVSEKPNLVMHTVFVGDPFTAKKYPT